VDIALLLVFTAPIAIASIGETIGQKSGVINIGIEGMMLSGAFFGMLVSLQTGNPWLGVLAGTATGLLLALLASWFAISLATDQVVVGTAINLLALGVTSTLFRSRFGSSGQLLTVPKLPTLAGIDAVILLMLVCIPLAWLLLNRTALGLALKAAGEYPKAVEAAGYSVAVLRTFGLTVSGAFAGLAGAYLSLGIAGSVAENMSAGRGFVAIALVTFGRWHPILVFAAALLVGYAETLQFALQAKSIGIPYQFFVALPYIVALVVLVISGKGTMAPRALAIPYRRDK
jgi:ABC-type uncharacterized transport system permease subunit